MTRSSSSMTDLANWTPKRYHSSPTSILWTTRIKSSRTESHSSTRYCQNNSMLAHHIWLHSSTTCLSTIHSSDLQQRNACRTRFLTKLECQLWSVMLLRWSWRISTRFCLSTTTQVALETQRRVQRWQLKSSTTSRLRSSKRSTCWENSTQRIEKDSQLRSSDTWCPFYSFWYPYIYFFVWQPNLLTVICYLFVSIEHNNAIKYKHADWYFYKPNFTDHQ